jgi:hypothetical protein
MIITIILWLIGYLLIFSYIEKGIIKFGSSPLFLNRINQNIQPFFTFMKNICFFTNAKNEPINSNKAERNSLWNPFI